MSALGTSLQMTFAFVLMLGVLITVHEFGHFLVAKWCGVRVLKFSIGFGPPIGIGRFRLAWHRGGTDYVVAWIPLGGFVKMLGENPDEADTPEALADREHSLPAQPTWKKLAIVGAGPAMNLLLPVVVFVGFLWVGVERPAPVVGTVEPGSPAVALGIEPGDRIVAIGGEPVRFWNDFDERVRESPGETVSLVIERDGERIDRDVEIPERPGVDLFLAEKEVGWLGLQHTRQKPVVGVPDARSRAGRAGLRSGDLVTAVDGAAVEDWAGFERALAAASGPVRLAVERGEGEAAETLEVRVPGATDPEALGLIPAAALVVDVAPGLPAERAGIRPGDLLVAVDGEPIGSFQTFRETVLASGGRPLDVLVARDGETLPVRLAPERSESPQEGVHEEIFRIGIQGASLLLPGAARLERVRNPLEAVPRAVGMTLEVTRVYLVGLGRIVSGELSRRNIGGPIEIAKQSHEALKRGWSDYLSLLLLISINLGVLNLLPIPVLDGGQALLFTVEGIKRSPLSLRARELVQSVGLALIVMLMGFAFWNDIARNWSTIVDWVKGL